MKLEFPSVTMEMPLLEATEITILELREAIAKQRFFESSSTVDYFTVEDNVFNSKEV